jgi:hypothetical protein
MVNNLIDGEKYQSIIKDWIQPAPQGITVSFFRSGGEDGKGLFAIVIPEQVAEYKPFLVVRTLLDDDKRRDFLLGYVKRRRANVEPTTPHDLQTLLRDGQRFGELQQRLDALTEQFRKLIETQIPTAVTARIEPVLSDEDLHSRILAAAKAASLDGAPIFALTAIPMSQVEILGLFASRAAPVVKALENPRELRRHGFNLGPGRGSRIVSNQLRRDAVTEWHTLELWRDGVLIYVSDAGGGLSWGQPRPGWRLLINPLALCEMTYLFAELSRTVYENARPNLAGVMYNISLSRFNEGEQPDGLRNSLDIFADVQKAPTSDFDAKIPWTEPQIDSGRIAFQLVAEIFRWFGFEDQEIPYSAACDGELVIDPELMVGADRARF